MNDYFLNKTNDLLKLLKDQEDLDIPAMNACAKINKAALIERLLNDFSYNTKEGWLCQATVKDGYAYLACQDRINPSRARMIRYSVCQGRVTPNENNTLKSCMPSPWEDNL